MTPISQLSLGHLRGSLLLAALALGCGAPAFAGSIWPTDQARERSMIADKKASGIGDILTIVVSETAIAQSSQSKKSSRDSSIEDAVQQFLYANSRALTHRGGLPGLKLGGSASYSGGGDISNTQSLSARAAVLVTDVLPNGNFVIEGTRIVTFSGETQYVVLHGLVRADDVGRDNTVASSNIADARVEFYSEGQLTDAQKRGWFAKLYEKLRPF
ncbi:flagellar basal body L-ring protein FlgH [Opitutus terrae]|uniref:Flagellar L-ring protein n=1 Tax=Opitutus terrae (strain DSM 11246 / JCM 15787 / PB90-1) TaxID=452637 RepID=B1ZR18_OPITP|nr:flagellar basal body L-ring protein FlgH [Opitutus terrae]ACB73685.1 flagellar L-ring protein [Opitutus terrae PB90-1]